MSGPYVTERGFMGTALTDDRGASVRVQESSSATYDAVWIFIEGGEVQPNKGHAHLDYEQATQVRDALTKWIANHSPEERP